VSWDAPLYQSVVGYRVYYHTSPSADIDDWQSIEIGPYTVTEIGGLAPNTLYAFRVRAKAADGRYGNFSSVAMLRRHDTGVYKTRDEQAAVLLMQFTVQSTDSHRRSHIDFWRCTFLQKS